MSRRAFGPSDAALVRVRCEDIELPGGGRRVLRVALRETAGERGRLVFATGVPAKGGALDTSSGAIVSVPADVLRDVQRALGRLERQGRTRPRRDDG